MKYVAIIETENELPEEVIDDIKDTTFVGDFPTPYRCKITSIKQAPEKQPVLIPCEYRENDYAEGYNQALRDCKILE